MVNAQFVKGRIAACAKTAPRVVSRTSNIAAAVLVPLIERTGVLNVLFTLRTEHLAYHPGQISFPGGRAEGDESLVETALREAREEIGLEPDQAEILGTLPDYTTLSGYHITPVVALIDPVFQPKPDPFEVAEVFEVPLAFFLDSANHQRHRSVYEGVERQYYAMPFENRNIWGATAGMLYDFYCVLREEETKVRLGA
jgi:8-oxo-dGTP pyrophosphatase MutT (NUDIX family)